MRGSNSIFKAGSGFVLCVALLAGLLWRSLPITIKRSQDIARGEELNRHIKQYQQQHATLPATDDWAALKQLGFTTAEMERGYPQYSRLTETTYQLVFLLDFDGPYLMWNSREQKWKEDSPIAAKP